MPNSLNRIFRHFREKQKQRKNNEFNNENYQINFNLNKTSGLSGCCSRKTSSSIPSDTIQKKNSWTIGRKNSDQLSQINFEQIFSDVILFRIFDAIENPFELIRLKRVCKKAAEYVRNRISNIIELDVRRVKFETLSASSLSSSCSISNNSNDSITSTIIEGELWHTHPNGCKVLGRISNYLNKNKKEENKENEEDEENKFTKEEKIKNEQKFKLEILVDEQWTSREISVLCSLLNEFRFNLNQISLDAPIFELIVARLASIDLERWFAYQCFVKAIDECQMNAALNKLAAQLQQQQQDDPFDKSDNLYWPNAKTIVIRTTENESIHLARVLNYGVRSNLVMDKRQLNCFSLQVCLKDSKRAATLGIAAQRPKQLVRNLYHFRCWAGSPGFDERFSQHWKASSRAA